MTTLSLFLALLAAPVPAAPPRAEHQGGQLIPTEPITFATARPVAVGSEAAVASLVCALRADPKLTLHIEVRIAAIGYGETLPVDPNTTADGRAQNRRVELHTAPVADAWCTSLAEALAAGRSASWTRSESLDAASIRMERCLGPDWTANRDGEALYAQHPSWLLSVDADPAGARVSLQPAR